MPFQAPLCFRLTSLRRSGGSTCNRLIVAKMHMLRDRVEKICVGFYLTVAIVGFILEAISQIMSSESLMQLY